MPNAWISAQASRPTATTSGTIREACFNQGKRLSLAARGGRLARTPTATEPEEALAGAPVSRLGSATLRDRDVVPLRWPRIELARPPDLLCGVFDHLVPLGDPAHGPGDGEQHGEHRGGEAHRLQDDARIEIDIRIKLLLDEIIVGQRDLLELH